MIDGNIIRWIYSSAAKYFSDAAQKAEIPFYLNSYTGDKYWAEFRFNGPLVEESTIGSASFICEINILITAFIGDDDYLIHRLVGTFLTAFTNEICVYKYGDGDQDDQSYIGALQLLPSDTNKIDIVHYGVIAPTTQQKRSSIEARYTMKW